MNVADGCSSVPRSCRRESGLISQVSGVEGTKSGCRTNTTQTHEFSTRAGSGTEAGTYYVPSKSSHRLEYINDMAYRLSTKMTSESQDSPWRYMPVVKRVRVAIQPAVVQKDESDMATEPVGSALHLAERDGASEMEDGSQDRRSFLSDVKFLPVGRKAGVAANSHIHPNTVHTYRKLESEAEEKRRVEKLERIEMHQKMARLERELRLQKSLSEECEDLGVDEPSTSELFPEADLLLDPSSSPSFEQTIQDAPCSQTVETTEPYSGSNFRHECSSSSQEGSHHEDPCVDNQVTDDSESRRETRTFGSKKSYSDWKYRLAGKVRSKCNTPVNLLRGEKSSAVVDVMKDNSQGQSCPLNNGSKNISQSSSSVEESLNGSSKCDISDGVATSLVLDSSSEHTVESASGKCNRNEGSLAGDQRISLPEKSILVKTLRSVTPRTASAHLDSELEELQDKGPKQVPPGTITIPCESNVEPKVGLPVTSSSSEDSVTLDSFATSMVASSLDVTIPSPVPAALSLMPSAHLLETSNTRDPVPSHTAAQKFTYTYGKKLSSSRQDVGRVIKRTRRPNQYFNDHADSQETWDSSSSQDKIGADDEDSDEMSPCSHMSSQLDDGANTDVDVVEVSNDESSSSPFPLLRTVLNKVSVSDPQNIDGTLKLSSTNGMDSVDGKSPTNSEKILSSKKNRPDKRFFTDTGTDSDFIGSNAKSARIREHRFDQSGLLHEKKIKGVPSLPKINVPTKESTVVSSSVDISYKKQQGLCAKQQGGGETCETTSVDPSDLQVTPASMTEIDMMPTPDGEDLVSKVCLEGKNECPSGGTCETHLKPTRSSRRRGHIKKCQCCNGSPERPKKKKHIVKVEKLIKKGQPPKQIGKMSVTKKR